jgi:hypothetical protein
MKKKGMSSAVCGHSIYLLCCIVQQEEPWGVSAANEELKEEAADEYEVCTERLVDFY